MEIRTVQVTRYVTPLREGGSLPAIAEADDGFLYCLKFRGAGQGTKALVAEIIGGEIARIMGLRVPEIVFAQLDEAFGRTEPDEEIQDLLRASTGLNLAMHYLSGAITYDPAVVQVDAETASKIVWLDAYLMNVDRTIKNTNMLYWQKQLWLIDHGAGLYFHHQWPGRHQAVSKPFIQIKDHVLLQQATQLAEVNKAMQRIITPHQIRSICDLLPNDWLTGYEENDNPNDVREAYYQFLTQRLLLSDTFTQHAINAR